MPNLTKSVTMTDGGSGKIRKKKKDEEEKQTTKSQTGTTASAGTGRTVKSPGITASGGSTAGSGVGSGQTGTKQGTSGIPSAAGLAGSVRSSLVSPMERAETINRLTKKLQESAPSPTAFVANRFGENRVAQEVAGDKAQELLDQYKRQVAAQQEAMSVAGIQAQIDELDKRIEAAKSGGYTRDPISMVAVYKNQDQIDQLMSQRGSLEAQLEQKNKDPSVGSMFFDTVGWGAGKANSVGTSTLDFLANLPARLEGAVFGEDPEGTFFGQLLKPITDVVGKLNDYTHNTTDKIGAYLNEQTKDNKAANLAVNIGSDLIAAAPIAILALLSGGSSAAAQLGPQASGLAETTYQVLSTMAKDPIYWANVAKYLGPKYDRAIANGATENEALVSALLSAPVDAAVDSRSGTETLPQRTRDGVLSAGEKFWKLLSSAAEEGVEGVTQDTLDNLVDKAVYDKDKPYFSMTDENAVFNPKVAAANAVSDMATAMAVGSGQLLTDAAANRLRNAWERKRLEWAVSGENLKAGDLGEDTVRAALAMPEGTEARSLAEQATIARQAEILGKLEELNAAKKQAGEIQTSAQLLEFTKTVGRLEQELEALEQGRLSDRFNSEDLGRLAKAVEDGQADLTDANSSDKIASQAEPYIETLKTINMKLEGTRHPVTGVPFKRYRFELDGKTVEAVGPEFETRYTAHLPKDQYFASDRVQNRTCSLELYEAAMKDSQLRASFDESQLYDLKKGRTPRGYTWHHSVVTGEMQLVDYETHKNTPHTGGRNIWGGGTKYR